VLPKLSRVVVAPAFQVPPHRERARELAAREQQANLGQASHRNRRMPVTPRAISKLAKQVRTPAENVATGRQRARVSLSGGYLHYTLIDADDRFSIFSTRDRPIPQLAKVIVPPTLHAPDVCEGTGEGAAGRHGSVVRAQAGYKPWRRTPALHPTPLHETTSFVAAG